MDVTTLGWRTDLLVRRLAGSTIEDRGDHLVVRTPANPAFWWGNFLLLPDLPPPDAAQRWLDLFTTAFPDAEHRAIGVDQDVTGRPVVELPGLTAELGVTLATQTLVAPRRESVAEVRALETDDDWTQLLELRMLTRHSEAPATDDDRLFEGRRVTEQRAVVGAGHGRWFGGFVGDRLVAACGLLVDGAGLGRYQSVQTHPEWRRRGIASQLVHTAGETALAELGVTTLVIIADLDNVAADLYRSVGFADVEQQVQYYRPDKAAS
jgi:ribosomal protein S18 acetylase RimI-like enzyme